jgi:hypothetical protein
VIRIALVLVATAACHRTHETHEISCQQLADGILALDDRQPNAVPSTPDVRRTNRALTISRCETANWDELERRCVRDARDFSALLDCEVAGDRRRHPEWAWR